MKKVMMLFMGLFLVSCASNMVDKNGVKEITSSKGVLITLGPESAEMGHYYKVGAQGLLDILLTSGGGKDIKKVMNTLNALELSKNQLIPSLKTHLDSIDHKKIYIENSDLVKRKNRGDGEYNYSLTEYTQNYDYAVILEVNRFGASRPFWGFIPTGAPGGNANLNLQIVDLRTYKLLASVNATADVPVDGEWREAPEYTKLKKSSIEAFELASKTLVNKVFE